MTAARPRAPLGLDAVFVALLGPSVLTAVHGVDCALQAAVRDLAPRTPVLHADATGDGRAVLAPEAL
jgi:hypothetical protein